jgi:hypothetical protein
MTQRIRKTYETCPTIKYRYRYKYRPVPTPAPHTKKGPTAGIVYTNSRRRLKRDVLNKPDIIIGVVKELLPCCR